MLPCSPNGVSAFYFFKTGARAGLPLSRCIRCLAVQKGRSLETGYVPIDEFRVVFSELVSRIGYIETMRRTGMSTNLIYRIRFEQQRQVRLVTMNKTKVTLAQVKRRSERRHPKDIRYGRNARGKVEKRWKRLSAFDLQVQDRFYSDKNPVDESAPDYTWWVSDQNAFIPRYGSEMLGDDF